MAESPGPLNDLDRGWQRPAGLAARSRVWLYVWRASIASLFLVVLCIFAYFVLRPLWEPKTHFIILSSPGDSPNLGRPPVVAGLELDRFESLSDTVRLIVRATLATPSDALRSLASELDEAEIEEYDTLILYVAANGISFQGQAQLVCDNFQPDDPTNGLIPVDEVLDKLRSSPARIRLLILDAGRYDYDPALGIVVNDFPRLLKQAVQAAGVDGLWVLCSHSDFERSHQSAALGGSVFGTFVAKGLQGAADTNGDESVDANELTDFVADWVGSWVAASTDEAATQSPILIGGDSNGSYPILLSVEPLDRELGTVSIPELITPTYKVADGAPRQDAPAQRPSGFLTRLGTPAADSAGPPTAVIELSPSVDAETDEAKEEAAKEAAANRVQQFASLLSKAWLVRDKLAEPRDAGASPLRPVDSTPQLWREFQADLIREEAPLRSAFPVVSPGTLDRLATSLAKFWTEQDGKPVIIRDFLQLQGDATAGRPAPPPIEIADLRSLTLAIRIAQQLPPIPLTAKLAELSAVLDTLIDTAPDQLTQQLADLKIGPEFDKYYELRLVKQLIDAGPIDPNLIQLALRARRDGERIAAKGGRFAAWISDDVLAGDRQRIEGEQTLLDRFGADWQVRADARMLKSLQHYAAADAACRELLRAEQLRNEWVFRAPYYVRLCRTAGPGASIPSGSIDAFLDSLIELSELLDNPSSSDGNRLGTLRERMQSLVRLDKQLGDAVRDSSIDRLTGSHLGDAWKIQNLLETPLPSANGRQNLVRTAGYFHIQLAPEYAPNGKSPPIVSDEVQTRAARLCGWEMKLAELAGWEAVGDNSNGLELRELRGKFQALAASGEQDIWQRIGEFSAALHQFYRDLPNRIDAGKVIWPELAQRDATSRVIQAQRALSSLDPRRAQDSSNVTLQALARDLELHDSLAWEHERFLRAAALATAQESDYLAAAAKDFGTQSMKLFRPATQLVLAERPTRLQVPLTVSLVAVPEREIAIAVDYRDLEAADVQLSLQYDPELLEVVRAAGQTQLDETDLTFRNLRNRERRTLRVLVRGRARHADTARLIVDAVTNVNASVDNDAERVTLRRPLVRQSIEIPLRVLELVVDGPPNSFRNADDKIVLHSFPNRVTNYGFGVVNRGPVDREVQLRFFSPGPKIDLSALPERQIAQLLSRLTPVGQLAISAPADAEPHFPAAAAAEEPPAVAADSAPAAAPPAEEPAAEPTGPRLERGLWVEVSDPKDPRQTYVKQLDLVPQRPRRYVRPTVAYNARLERIEVRVEPLVESLLPPGPVNVDCEIAEDTASATEGKLHDVLAAPNYQASLFVNVPAAPPQVVTLYLHVDGFPRAFIYRVRCGAQATDLPEKSDSASLRIRKLAWQEFQPPAPVTPLEAQIDAPLGTFESGVDSVRVALDENMDEQLGPETGLRYPVDRQVDLYLAALGDDGVLALDTRVKDYQVALSTDRLQNVRVQVHGRLVAGGNQSDADAITLNIDGAGPRVQFVEVAPWGGFVVVDTPLGITAHVMDAMSGVKVVEVGFDVDGTGQFSEKAPPVAAILDPEEYSLDAEGNVSGPGTALHVRTGGLGPSSSQRWFAALPTESLLGVQTLLIRATDQVGNVSEYYPKRVQILTPEQATAKIEAQARTVEGTVIFRDTPVPNAVVTLRGPENAEVASGRAGEDGQFSIGNVPVGEFQVSAEGVINNVPRFGAQPVVVELAPSLVVRADIHLE